VGFVPAGAVPDQESVAVAPTVVGTVTELVGGVEAEKRTTAAMSVTTWRMRKGRNAMASGSLESGFENPVLDRNEGA
jgi:hypothetical protein